jgi:hypothetical protein
MANKVIIHQLNQDCAQVGCCLVSMSEVAFDISHIQGNRSLPKNDERPLVKA